MTASCPPNNLYCQDRSLPRVLHMGHSVTLLLTITLCSMDNEFRLPDEETEAQWGQKTHPPSPPCQKEKKTHQNKRLWLEARNSNSKTTASIFSPTVHDLLRTQSEANWPPHYILTLCSRADINTSSVAEAAERAFSWLPPCLGQNESRATQRRFVGPAEQQPDSSQTPARAEVSNERPLEACCLAWQCLSVQCLNLTDVSSMRQLVFFNLLISEKERKTSICCSTNWCTHWLLLVCAVTGNWT